MHKFFQNESALETALLLLIHLGMVSANCLSSLEVKLFTLLHSFQPSLDKVTIKGQLQRFYKLVSYERAVKILKNDICITEIGQVVLEIFEFKVKFPRKIPKIRNFANVSIIRVEQQN